MTADYNPDFGKWPAQPDIVASAERIAPYIHKTAVLTSDLLNQITGNHLFFKCENFQKAGAFKSRGAMNAILSIGKSQLSSGVATHSSGNHAQALARAASIAGTKAFIVMPETAPQVKVDAVRAYGGIITFCEPTLAAREQTLKTVVEQTGAHEIHPYNDYRIIAGQASCFYEFNEQCEPLDILLCPVGGGGLLSGTALAIKYFSPATKLIACEPEGADDAFRSFKSGKLIPVTHTSTIADGLLTSLGSLTFPIIKELVSDVVTVSDAFITEAMRLIWSRMKILVEPSAAVPLAALLQGRVAATKSRIGIILSGGNIDLNKIPWYDSK
jgi:threonine dehydratase